MVRRRGSAELAVSGSAPRLAGAGLRQRPAGTGRPADNPLAAGATADDARPAATLLSALPAPFSGAVALDQLRQRAFGFAPARRPPGSPILRRPAGRPYGQLACETLSRGACCHRGFSLPLSRWRRRPVTAPALKFAFYPQAAGGLVAESPAQAAPLLHLPLPGEPPRLLLRPPFSCSPTQAEGWRAGTAAPAARRAAPRRGPRRVASLRRQLAAAPAVASCRPAAGGYSAGHRAAARAPGRPADPAAGEYCYPSSHGPAPERLVTSEHQAGWLAATAGGSAEDARWVARQLSLLTVPVNPPGSLPAPAGAASNGWLSPGQYGAAGLYSAAGWRLAGGSAGAGAALRTALLPAPAGRAADWLCGELPLSARRRSRRAADGAQSPDRRAVELLRCCKTFLRQLPPLDEAAFRPLQQRTPHRSAPGRRPRRRRWPPCVRSMLYRS